MHAPICVERLTHLRQVATSEPQELEQLKAKGIPVDGFYMRYGDNQQRFEHMATYTGGKAFPFSTTRPEGRECLIGHITTSMLKYIGGGEGDALVDAYNNKFGKLHS